MLSWKPPKSDGGSPVTKYLIEKCDTKKNRWTAVGEVDAQTLSYNVQKLLEDQPYLFRVSAINAEGQGKPLLTDSETTPKKPAGNVTKTKVKSIYISFLGVHYKYCINIQYYCNKYQNFIGSFRCLLFKK